MLYGSKIIPLRCRSLGHTCFPSDPECEVKRGCDLARTRRLCRTRTQLYNPQRYNFLRGLPVLKKPLSCFHESGTAVDRLPMVGVDRRLRIPLRSLYDWALMEYIPRRLQHIRRMGLDPSVDKHFHISDGCRQTGVNQLNLIIRYILPR